MKTKRSNFQPDFIPPYPDSTSPRRKSRDDELTALLASIEADQVLDATLNELEAIDVDALTPEQLGEALVAGFAVQEQILDAWGRDLAAQAIALGLDPKALRLPLPSDIKP